MELTLEELEALEPGSYTLLDLRSEQETAYGTIPGSVPANAAALPEGLPAEPGRIVLFCTRGKLSLETAERLRDEGFDACSLKGGYLAWLMRQMQRQEAEELCSRVENSLRKRFRLKLWCISSSPSGGFGNFGGLKSGKSFLKAVFAVSSCSLAAIAGAFPAFPWTVFFGSATA